ncbi:putative disease resistance protein [Citrus sinensis]|uniref:probable disease resistance protein At5g63020 n=1 Tax=Citrus sinensis TaxID=2711 RepID=UPI00218F7E7D|nr:probable disease resistance protein At5g63020 [Citrus sinensis]KAH9667223.1 putative disease resistance protein [Citrus sinensis]
MGNVIGIQFSCDAILSHCLNCTLSKATCISQLEDNLVDLQAKLEKLIEAKNDVMMRVVIAERQQMRCLNQVQGWLSRVQSAETEAGQLIRDGSQEIEKLCLGGYCSKNCKSSYNFGKEVAQKVQLVETLMGEKDFAVVAQRAQESVADERPTEPIVVGLQSQLEQVWRCLVEEPAGIVGLYGMGGVGKTTLVTHINNKFLQVPNDFDCVIWVVVSKDLRLENIQEIIGGKIGLMNESWKSKSLQEKSLDIFKILREKKFVLLLDDLWQRVDLTKVGVPIPSPQSSASKVVFTTRSEEICGLMEAQKKFKVACLSDKDAWELFCHKVGEETLNNHPDIPELAQTVAKECGGMPLALITIGRAMSCKRTPQEWRHAIQVLRTTASEFPGLGNEVYPLLKFSYESLPNDIVRSCLLYCSLYPEDYRISKENLIDCWIGESFLNERVKFEVQNQGYYILGILVHACLLEEVGEDEVKMHDVIRDMALWIACDSEKKGKKFLVCAGAGLTEDPGVRGWENVSRLSLMQNRIKNLSEIPKCPHLLTLFLNSNELKIITNDFFQFMPSLKVLSLSRNRRLTNLQLGISKLVSLQHLDLSLTNIEKLSGELKAVVNLKCLNLEYTWSLVTIPQQLIASFLRLHVLRMFGVGDDAFEVASEDSVLFDGGEFLVEELLGLNHLEVLSLTLRSPYALQSFLTSHKLQCCTQALFLQYFKDSTSLVVSSLANLKRLNVLRIADCEKLEELKIDYTGEIQHFGFRSLCKVEIARCQKLKDLTFLVFAPNLESIEVKSCLALEEIVSDVPEAMGNLNLFAKLQYLELLGLPNLKSIYWKPLSFPRLKEMTIITCNKLKKLPVDSNSAKECKIVIRGDREWWRQLQWEDEATQNVFLPCFKSLLEITEQRL